MKHAITALILFGLSSAGQAATVSNATVIASDARATPSGIDGACGSPDASVGPTFASISSTAAGCQLEARARVGSGFLSAYVEQAMDQGFGPDRQTAFASTSQTLRLQFGVDSSYVYTGPERVEINLDASAFLGARFQDLQPSSFTTGGSALVSGFVEMIGSTNNFNLQRDREEFRFEKSISRTTALPESGGDIGLENQTLQLAINTDPRRPITLRLGMSATSSIVGSRSARVEGIADGSQTLNFASDRDVFVLPEGVTADFEGLSIVNNRWVDPRLSTDPISTVPLPAGLPLLLAGLGAFTVMRRRK